MKAKVWLLPLALGIGLSSVYFLPQAGSMAESAIRMDLPEVSGNWIFRHRPPSKEEVDALAKDTSFSKAICLSARPGEYGLDGYNVADRIDLSVVLSGHDLNNSIHRPERCMPAQGHTITGSSNITLELANGRRITMCRLKSIQNYKRSEDPKEDEQYNCITYYFFVGQHELAHSHLDRTFIDMRDRLIFGQDQRWAYASASMWYGKVPWIEGKEVSEAEADQKLQRFLGEFSQRQINWDQLVP